jgi:TRAP-type C4-dicarboxylate transport system permease large subunit
VFGTSIGFVTPPYGLNLFIVSSVMETPYDAVARSIWLLLLPLFLAWAVIAMLPNIVQLLFGA